MDFLRSCYTTQMQFDEAGDLIADVQWYWCLPGAKLFPRRNSFCSANWDQLKYNQLGLGEVWNSPRPYSKGTPPAPAAGDGRHCGPLHWFTHGCPSDAPPITRGPTGIGGCCLPGGLLLGGRYTASTSFVGKGGLFLGGKYSYTPPVACQPYDPFNYASATMLQVSSGLYWGQFGSGPSNIFFIDPVIHGFLSYFVAQSNSSPCTVSWDGTFMVYHYTPTGYVAFLPLISYNPATYIGVWQMPAASPNYASQFFEFYILT
jgi:hypothetical protein